MSGDLAKPDTSGKQERQHAREIPGVPAECGHAARVANEQRAEHAVRWRVEPAQREIPAGEWYKPLNRRSAEQRRDHDARKQAPQERASREEHNGEWRNEIELLFDRDRPRWGEPSSRRGAQRRPDVLGEQQIRVRRYGGRSGSRAPAKCRGERDGEQQEVERKDPACSAHVEDAQKTRRLPMIEEDAPDEEARDDEKQIDAPP
jgi:hypothetical protein